MSFPEMIRNVAIVGHLHHGKTALMDMLVFETHKLIWDADKPVSAHLLQSVIITEEICRSAIRIRTLFLGREKSLLNPPLCHLFLLQRVENHI